MHTSAKNHLFQLYDNNHYTSVQLDYTYMINSRRSGGGISTDHDNGNANNAAENGILKFSCWASSQVLLELLDPFRAALPFRSLHELFISIVHFGSPNISP